MVEVGGFPTLPTVVVQSDKLFDSNKIIIQEKEEIISNIPLVKKQVKEITKVKIAQETKDIFSKEKIINQPIYTNETELKDKNNNLNLEAKTFSGNINIKLIILIIIFLSVVIILLLVNKFSKFKNL